MQRAGDRPRPGEERPRERGPEEAKGWGEGPQVAVGPPGRRADSIFVYGRAEAGPLCLQDLDNITLAVAFLLQLADTLEGGG